MFKQDVTCNVEVVGAGTKALVVDSAVAEAEAAAAGFTRGKSGFPKRFFNRPGDGGKTIQWDAEECNDSKNNLFEYPVYPKGNPAKHRKDIAPGKSKRSQRAEFRNALRSIEVEERGRRKKKNGGNDDDDDTPSNPPTNPPNNPQNPDTNNPNKPDDKKDDTKKDDKKDDDKKNDDDDQGGSPDNQPGGATPLRVVFTKPKKGKLTYCGVMTHPIVNNNMVAQNGNFNKC